MNKMFRPQEPNKRMTIRLRHRGYSKEWTSMYNFVDRAEWYPVGWGKHRQQFARRFARLHYLACHAPRPVQLRWRAAYREFMNRYFGDGGQASMRYLNKWSSHSWL